MGFDPEVYSLIKYIAHWINNLNTGRLGLRGGENDGNT